MPQRLIFGQPRYAGGPVHLVFGSGTSVVVPDPLEVTVTVQLDDVSVTALATYDNRNPRRASSSASAEHQVARRAEQQQHMAHGLSTRADLPGLLPWQPARHAQGAPLTSWGTPARAAAEHAAPWSQAASAGEWWALVHQQSGKLQQQTAAAWALAAPLAQAWALVHQQAAQRRLHAVPVWQMAAQASTAATARFGRGTQRHRTAVAPWHVARPAPAGRTVWVPVDPGGITPHVPSTHLVFACPRWAGGPVHLVFGHVCVPSSPALVVIPVRTYYMTINSIALRRVDGNVPLLAHSFSMSIDADSWTWSWSAALDRSAEAAVQPDMAGQPVELEAVVNGVPYRLLVGSVGRSRQFPATRISVKGQGLAAVLAAPTAPVTTHASVSALTAQQLMEQVLTVNGQPIGWTLDWGLTDWLVPANAWTFQGTPMEALVDIAGAAGGYLQPHATAQTLRVLPRYPIAPWEWASAVPDIELPQSAVEVESMDWVDRPAYNRVFIGGVGSGVFGPVTRAGSAGDVIAPQVTHPLITHADAHRQRGLAVLADTGRQVHMSLRMQVLPETGLILPGQMVRYAADQARVGIVRSMSVDWSSPVMRQTIGVESHAA